MKKNRKFIFKLTQKKEIKLFYTGPFVAKNTPFFIQIDEYFKSLPKDTQKAIIWHELYHRNKVGLRYIWWILKYGEKAKWIEEFNADLYSAKMCGKKNTLAFLKEAKKFYDKGIVDYDSKTHPPIEERIKKIKELK